MSRNPSDPQETIAPPSTVVDAITFVIEQHKPERLFLIGHGHEVMPNRVALALGEAGAQVISADQLTRDQLTSSPPCRQLGVVWAESLTDMDILQSRRLLGLLRDTVNGQVVVICGPAARQAAAWQLTELIAMGYRRMSGSGNAGSEWMLYCYDIHNYKTTPDWLNKRHWANPQRWDQERW